MLLQLFYFCNLKTMSKGDVLVDPEIKLWLIMSNYSKAFLKAGVINDPGKY